MNLLMNVKSPLLIGVRRSKKTFAKDSAFVNQRRFQALYISATKTSAVWISDNFPR